jgi:hypothetical protein
MNLTEYAHCAIHEKAFGLQTERDRRVRCVRGSSALFIVNNGIRLELDQPIGIDEP